MPIKKIDTKTLKNWIDSGEAIVLDVREPAEHRAQKIKDAHNISYTKITKDKLPEYKSNQNKIVLHCQSGRRSSIACQKLMQEDPSLEVYELEGGISAWLKNNLATESTGKNILPIDRQVQISVGLILILCSLLTLLINTNFIFIILAMGCGLMFAGLSGTCMLAILLTKMPWNK